MLCVLKILYFLRNSSLIFTEPLRKHVNESGHVSSHGQVYKANIFSLETRTLGKQWATKVEPCVPTLRRLPSYIKHRFTLVCYLLWRCRELSTQPYIAFRLCLTYMLYYGGEQVVHGSLLFVLVNQVRNFSKKPTLITFKKMCYVCFKACKTTSLMLFFTS